MFAPALGMLTAVWLLLAPFVELETGARLTSAVVVGLASLVLAPLSIWSRRAGPAMAVLGVALSALNFIAPGSVGSMADLATCGVLLAIAGLAPSPVAEVLPAVSAIEGDVVTARIEAFHDQRAAAAA